MSSDANPAVRCTAARALREAAVEFPHIRKLILDRFRDPEVSADDRRCYGRALADAAPCDSEIRKLFIGLLEDNTEPTEMKAAAAAGLAFLTRSDDQARRVLVELLDSRRTPARLRRECATALKQAIGHDDKVNDLMIDLLDERDHPMLARIANQAVAEALAEGRMSWDAKLVNKVEGYLIAVPNPCPHALEDLENLLRTKEMRGGLRLNTVLQDFLEKHDELIHLSFIFGLTARLTQNANSDIDLFIVGDVRLKDLSLTLAEAEQVLGRPINPVIYTKGTFLKKLHERDPFLLQVLNGEKIVLGGFDDELRAVASKWAPHQAETNGDRTQSALVHR